ncbi:MAG TPA: TIGR03084 family metal-binding protein [Actinophytocola sp.]|nr:TIGR03084 family metal-binding protein [Actinophytocola sp.]HEV2781542.1 TIGR03084 family metal-binding protein [Actinophytocola sp.]
MSELPDVIPDLAAETDAVDRLVADLDAATLASPTPAEGWTIRDQIGHLAFIFKLAGLAAADGETFKAVTAKAGNDFDAAINAALADYRSDPPELLISRWRAESSTAIKALAALPPMQPVPWLVRPLPAFILASAGMMELIGHGQDIADALGVRREWTDRIKHVVAFAVRVWDFGYLARGLTPPDAEFRFELTSPSGQLWEFGPADAEQRIVGKAVDFCLLVTRRRHRDDLELVATGAEADHWLDIAQAYRGSPGSGRQPGQFTA